ncbi:MAG: glycerate kinase [Phycisphaerales bacterium]
MRAAIAAADPRRCVAARAPADLRGRACRLIAAGKASAAMTVGLVADVGAVVHEGIVIGPPGCPQALQREWLARPPAVQVFEADHPLPTDRNVRTARAAHDVALRCSHDGMPLVVLISGGASAHLALPRGGVVLDDLRAVTQALLAAGANIHELNTVRKQLESLKGGGLARLAAPAPIDALILSDVLGDDPSVIASGPVTPNPQSEPDAIAVLRSRALDKRFPCLLEWLEERRARRAATPASSTPGDVRTTIVGNNALALAAAADAARATGFEVASIQSLVEGESRDVGGRLARLAIDLRRAAHKPSAILLGGETTVTVRGGGLGGRNQELVLAAAIELEQHDGILIASFGTDGVDGPTDAAGAWAMGGEHGAVAVARQRGVDARDCLARNDSHRFFSAAGTLLRTGPTGTNVNDIAFALVYP